MIDHSKRPILFQFATNSFTLSTPSLSPIGVAVSPLAALINHSCDPNVAILFPRPGSSTLPVKFTEGRPSPEPVLQVVAITDIPAKSEVSLNNSSQEIWSWTFGRSVKSCSRHTSIQLCPYCNVKKIWKKRIDLCANATFAVQQVNAHIGTIAKSFGARKNAVVFVLFRWMVRNKRIPVAPFAKPIWKTWIAW